MNNNNTTLSASSSTYQKKAVHSLLASRLTQLHIPSAAADDPSQDFEFSDFFGTAAAASPSSASPPLFLGDPQVIHHRSHSFVGPSPRFTLSKSLPNFDQDESEELYYSSSDDAAGDDARDGGSLCDGGGVAENGGNEVVEKVGPGDFEIMRVIGKGAFGKVFQVRKKGKSGGGDGIFAMKVMRKDTIIKNNHVDYMRAERDILTKTVHPFIVQLRYSFQVIFFSLCYLNYDWLLLTCYCIDG